MTFEEKLLQKNDKQICHTDMHSTKALHQSCFYTETCDN